MLAPGHFGSLTSLNSQSLLGELKITISAEHRLKEVYDQEIGLKMPEMAILETQIFKMFWGSCPPPQKKKLAPRALALPPATDLWTVGPFM